MLPDVLLGAARLLLGKDDLSIRRTWSVLSPPPETFANLNCRISGLLNRVFATQPFWGHLRVTGTSRNAYGQLLTRSSSLLSRK